VRSSAGTWAATAVWSSRTDIWLLGTLYSPTPTETSALTGPSIFSWLLDGQLGLSSVGRSRPRFKALADEVADETEAAALRIVPA
jgi:hypothetical protein